LPKQICLQFSLELKFEVFLRSADKSSTEIVDFTKRVIESYREIDPEFPDELVEAKRLKVQ